MFVKHIHKSYTPYTRFLHIFPETRIFIAHLVNFKDVTTRVCVVYMFDKHIHALNLLNINMITDVFRGACICLAFNSKKKFL